MIELLPALLTESRDDFEQKLRTIENAAEMAHIDIMDSTWLPATTWADPSLLWQIESPMLYELHLMVAHPLEHLARWEETPSVKRVIFHYETVTQPKQMIEAIRFHGWEAVIALNPETSVEQAQEFVPYADEIMFMTVQPGASGRPFESAVLEKIRACKQAFPDVIIGVDGAMNAATIPQCIAAGATRLRVNSSIFNAQVAPADALRHLAQVAAAA